MFAKLFRPFAWWTAGLATASVVVALASDRPNHSQQAAPAGEPKPKVTIQEDPSKQENPKVSPGLVHWHATFDDAKAAAEVSGKPVFLFQMLGQLDRQYCCTNSRIARTVLFSSKEIADQIDADFEPVWESVRSAPIASLDFGGGEIVRRSLHGHIATYICDSRGRVCDILPGIYTPKIYAEQLKALKSLADSARQLPEEKRADFLNVYHEQQANRLAVSTLSPQARNESPPSGAMGFGGIQGLGGQFGIKGGFVPDTPPAPTSFGNIQGIKGGFAPTGFPTPPTPTYLGGIEGPTELAIIGMPSPSGIHAPVPGPLADRSDLATGTRVNELVHRRTIHLRLATSGMVQPGELKKWLYKEILRTDLDDPLLGLGFSLTANYPFVDEDKVGSSKR